LEQVTCLLDLNDLRKRYPATLSGGQRQRTALGRALLSDPELLVMDEPLNAQDIDRQSRILDYLQRIAGEFSMNVLLVSHDVRLVDRLAAHCLYLDGGRLRTG
jgi:molybdate transport system ATP-binding protein